VAESTDRAPGEASRGSEWLAARLAAGLRLLREGKAAEAAVELEVVCRDPELAGAQDLRDVRARALSLYAQALWKSDRARDALPFLEAALRLARALGDVEGTQEIEAMRQQVRDAAGLRPGSDPSNVTP
jgi:hypothetical protein